MNHYDELKTDVIKAIGVGIIIAAAFAVGVLTARAEDLATIYEPDGRAYLVIDSAPDIDALPTQSNAPNTLETMESVVVVEPEPELEDLGEFTITYYCPCRKCNGKWGAIDSYGNPLKWGCVAVDPKVIPMHTKLRVEGYDKTFEALDTGGKWVRGKHIDMYVPVSHKEALRMGQGEKRKVWRVVE